MTIKSSIAPCQVLTVGFWPAYRFHRRQVRWSGIPISLRIFQFVVIHMVKSFSVVNEAEVGFFCSSLAFSVTQWMLTIWSLVPLPFLNPAWTSGSSWFTYCWSLSEEFSTLLCYCVRWVQLCSSVSILWQCLSLGLEWKLTISSPVATPEFPNLLVYWVQHFHSIIFKDLK